MTFYQKNASTFFIVINVAFEHVKLDIAKEQQVEIVFCCLLLVPPPPPFCSHHPLVTVFSFLKPSQKVQIKPSKPIPFSQSKLHCAHCTISDAKMMCHTHYDTLWEQKFFSLDVTRRRLIKLSGKP